MWSISAIDFSGGRGFSLIPPARGFDIANPSVARTSDDYFTFEAVDQVSGKADIYAARASTGDLNRVVVGVGSGFTSPVYSGNDRAIVYSYPDSTAATGSLAREHPPRRRPADVRGAARDVPLRRPVRRDLPPGRLLDARRQLRGRREHHLPLEQPFPGERDVHHDRGPAGIRRGRSPDVGHGVLHLLRSRATSRSSSRS